MASKPATSAKAKPAKAKPAKAKAKPAKANPAKRRGRPTKWDDPAVRKILMESLELGMTEEDAAFRAGIDPLTLRRWKNDPDFCTAIKKAILDGKAFHLRRIQTGQPGWTASAWWLERKFRLEWKRDTEAPRDTEPIEVSFKDET